MANNEDEMQVDVLPKTPFTPLSSRKKNTSGQESKENQVNQQQVSRQASPQQQVNPTPMKQASPQQQVRATEEINPTPMKQASPQRQQVRAIDEINQRIMKQASPEEVSLAPPQQHVNPIPFRQSYPPPQRKQVKLREKEKRKIVQMPPPPSRKIVQMPPPPSRKIVQMPPAIRKIGQMPPARPLMPIRKIGQMPPPRPLMPIRKIGQMPPPPPPPRKIFPFPLRKIGQVPPPRPILPFFVKETLPQQLTDTSSETPSPHVEKMSFKRTDIFGHQFAAFKSQAQGHVANMILERRIDKNGLVIQSSDLSELWSYIYVLVVYNKDHEVFKNFRAQRGIFKTKAMAKRFIKSLKTYSGHDVISPEDLVKFINETITNSSPNNPLLEKQCSNSNSNYTNYTNTSKTILNEFKKVLKTDSNDVNEIISIIRKSENEKETKSQKILDEFKKVLQTDSNNVYDMVELIRNMLPKEQKIIKVAQEKKEPVPCIKDNILKLNLQVKNIIESLILSRMCIIKYIGQIIVGPISNSETPCSTPRDLSIQRYFYSLFPSTVKTLLLEKYIDNKKNLLAIRNSLKDIMVDINCDNVEELRTRVAQYTQSLELSILELTNIFEDLNGSVRVYTRLRKIIPTLDDQDMAQSLQWNFGVNNTSLSLECSDGGMIRTFEGNFYGVFDSTYDNLGLYMGYHNAIVDSRNPLLIDSNNPVPKTWGLYYTFKQIESGYSIVISGYGQSGSGKTFNLIGNKKDPGVVLYGLANLKNISTIEILNVFELYYDYINFTSKTVRGKVIIGYDSTKMLKSTFSQFGIMEDNIVYDPITIPHKKLTGKMSISTFINENMLSIQNHQKSEGRIKITPNNNQSSRSHLFVVIKVGEGYFTIVDMAGQENCETIHKMIFNQKYSLTYLMMQFKPDGRYRGGGKQEVIGDYISFEGVENRSTLMVKDSDNLIEIDSDKIEKTVTANVQILYESIYITESLNHLQYFYSKKNGNKKTFNNMAMKTGSIQYLPKRVFIQPELEDMKRFNPNGKILIIPVMKYLEFLSKGRITKFVTIAALRPDKCENIDILNFAKQISEIKLL